MLNTTQYNTRLLNIPVLGLQLRPTLLLSRAVLCDTFILCPTPCFNFLETFAIQFPDLYVVECSS
jgi:hypothetical protein